MGWPAGRGELADSIVIVIIVMMLNPPFHAIQRATGVGPLCHWFHQKANTRASIAAASQARLWGTRSGPEPGTRPVSICFRGLFDRTQPLTNATVMCARIQSQQGFARCFMHIFQGIAPPALIQGMAAQWHQHGHHQHGNNSAV